MGRDCGRGRHVQWCFEILHHVRCEDCSCLSFQNLTSPFQPRLPAAPRAGPPRTANAIPGARPKPRIPPERGRLPLPFPHTFGPLRKPVLHTFTQYLHTFTLSAPRRDARQPTMQAQVSLALPLGSRSSRFHDQTSHVAAHFYSHSPAQLAQQLDAERSRIQQLQLLIDQEERKVCVQCAKAR